MTTLQRYRYSFSLLHYIATHDFQNFRGTSTLFSLSHYIATHDFQNFRGTDTLFSLLHYIATHDFQNFKGTGTLFHFRTLLLFIIFKSTFCASGFSKIKTYLILHYCWLYLPTLSSSPLRNKRLNGKLPHRLPSGQTMSEE